MADAPLVAATAALAALAVALAALPALALAWALARTRFALKPLVETLVLLPLVVPPVATGLLLLMAFGRRGPAGAWLARAGIEVAFTRTGVVVAMAVMAFPLFVASARAAIESVDARLEAVAATLGAGRLRVLRTITLPLAWPGLLGAALLAFARCLGEFGATMLLAGAIPGRTATIATTIWQRVQTGDDPGALRLVVVSLAIALGATLASGLLARRAGAR